MHNIVLNVFQERFAKYAQYVWKRFSDCFSEHFKWPEV